ncbi:Rieske 2Fe-2S domain-containing protein [Actinoplanes sp. NBRC 103695]|uniref:Rieske (2Fe-2S) protein n=1 Tax=Actinoplanes sp. NBRC 103695 TaxID=3032202 RepID=UPI0024A5559C|nr:Rieske 2Fe-2S domain-containing protein [Actinoplanes sp. NBRC 103695]GLZ01461.1 nitrite reductase [Actinoplanes sp. NBRC 103695]
MILGDISDIPLGEGRAYAVDDTQIAVFRLRDGSVRALSAVCPHRGGPLADGQIDLKFVVCPLHLNTFDLATGCSTGDLPPLTVYAVRVDDHDQLILEDS